jgi:flagellar export protein FliJ
MALLQCGTVMKPFKFSLESVLVLRRREEDAAKAGYAEAVGFRNRCREALEQAMVDLENLQAELSSKRMGPTRRDDHVLYIHAIRQQRDFSFTVSQRLVRAEQLIQVRMQTWLEARRRSEMLEKLREKHRQRHEYESTRKDERELDDLVGARHSINRASLAFSN